jgi:hypothetical protein
MLILLHKLRSFSFACAIVFISGVVSIAAGQNEANSNPCKVPQSAVAQSSAASSQEVSQAITTHGLTPVDRGQIVYDSNQGVCWLADANLAGNPVARQMLDVTGINPDGTMDYPTALNWVAALNSYNGGRGYLNHTHWQLPSNPLDDATCSSLNHGNFGVSCTGNGLGNLYSVGLASTYPESISPNFTDTIWPFENLQPGLYWTANPAPTGGETTFSFNTGLNGANTTKYNYLHVLALTHGAIGTPPTGTGVLPYTTGPAAGLAVYDPATGDSWILNANLAAVDTFGVTGTTTIFPKKKCDTSQVNCTTYIVPKINSDGAMLYSETASWLAGMNAPAYAGSTTPWEMPLLAEIKKLNKHLGLQPGNPALTANGSVGPFLNLQPGFYWQCERDPGLTSQSPCDLSLYPVPDYMYSFNFAEGFENTDKLSKQFYVMVYYPVPN